MPTPPQLLTTKLSAPLSPPDLAPRPLLVARLAEGLAGQLTLLSAPAGAGKTTLINAWRASESGRLAHLAWLLLDDDDNDPVRFLTYLGAALDTFRSGIGETALSLLQSPQPPEAKLVMTALINALGELPLADKHGFYVLVLDDYHVITAQPIHDALADFLAHLPAHVRLVISTRRPTISFGATARSSAVDRNPYRRPRLYARGAADPTRCATR